MTRDTWRNRIVGHGTARPDELVPNPANWRKHPLKQREAMGGAFEEVGWVQPVIVNRTTGRLVDGHLRVRLAIAHGETEVPVTFVELTEDEERLALATIDPIGDLAQRGADELHDLIGTLTLTDDDLSAFLGTLDKQALGDIAGTAEHRGKENDKRGRQYEKDLADKLGGEWTGWKGGKDDVTARDWSIQAKTGNNIFPERLWKLLNSIPIKAGQRRALVVAEEPKKGIDPRTVVVIELDAWREAEGLGPDVARAQDDVNEEP